MCEVLRILGVKGTSLPLPRLPDGPKGADG